MIMKKFDKKTGIFGITTMLMVLLSCTKLDETVYDTISAEDTQLSAEDLNNIIAPAFTSFRSIYWGWNGLFDDYEESSDLIVTPFRNGIGWGDLYITMHQHTWGSTLEHTEGLWSATYSGINNVNRAIYQMEQITGVSDMEKYTNELRALRAIYYYILLDNFRNVPIVTRYDLPAGFLPEQSTTKEVYDFIVSELNAVMPALSEDNTPATYGRITRWVAKMTLAKLYLNSGVYLGTDKWADALAQVNEIISSGKFSLATNYRDPFLAANEGSVEEILSIPFDVVYAPGSYYAYKTLYSDSQKTYNLAAAPWGGSGGIPQFIDTYDTDDIRLQVSWLGGPQYTSSGEPLIMENGQQLNYINYMSTVNGTEYNEGYRFIKYEIPSGLTGNQGNDVPFYRYTDALMIKAECLLRTGDAAGAAAIVTEIRRRDFLSKPEKATVTGAQLTSGSTYKYGEYANGQITRFEGGADIPYGRFLDELAWEFVGEHHRKQDLIRFGVYTTKSWFSHTPNGDYRKVFPIPQSQMDANHSLKQNDGYVN